MSGESAISPVELPAMHNVTTGLVRTVALSFAACAALCCGVLVLVNRAEWWRGFAAASVVSLLSAAVSLPPLIWGLRRGLHQAAGGYFAAAGLRAAASIAGCCIAVLAGHYPPVSTLLLMVAYYFAVLGAESIYLAKALWTRKD